MENKLLPCPFCGGKAYIRVCIKDLYKEQFVIDCNGDEFRRYEYLVRAECSVCHSRGKSNRLIVYREPIRTASGFTGDRRADEVKAEAIEAWNTRYARICTCGWHGFIDGWGHDAPNYCPNCGGRVMRDE